MRALAALALIVAMLLAEEMRLDPGQFDISFGDPSPAYWNTAMAGEAAPFLSNDQSFSARTVRTVMGAALKVLGMQVTGAATVITKGSASARRRAIPCRVRNSRARREPRGRFRAQLTCLFEHMSE